MSRLVHRSGALALVLLALFASILAPVAIARAAESSQSAAAQAWAQCQGTRLTHCWTYSCVNGRNTFYYWDVWQTYLNHVEQGAPHSCSNS